MCLVVADSHAAFTVTSGPCTTTSDGRCFRSPHFPHDYHNYEDCTITVSGRGSVHSFHFDTESCCDHVNIDGAAYSGSHSVSNTWLTLGNTWVTSESSITWHSDGNNTQSGFEICLGA